MLLAVLGVAATVSVPNGQGLARLLPFGAGLADGPAATTSASQRAEAAPPTAGLPTPPMRLVTGSGHVVALSEVDVHPRRGGTIVELAADIGTVVRAGQVLLRLDDPDLRFVFRAAGLARDRARLVLAARRLDAGEARSLAGRMAALAASGAVNGQTALDAGIAAQKSAILADQAALDLEEAELAVSKAEQAVAELTITAPIGGVVTARAARLGEAILAQTDARDDLALFTIVDPTRLAVDIDIAETAIAVVRPGLIGEAVLDAYPDRPFAVEVRRVAPVASSERGTVSLRLAILDPPAGIRPAMAVRAGLSLPEATAAETTASNTTGH